MNSMEQALRDLMMAFERRIRSECTPEQLQQEPWRCWEYIAAENALASLSAARVPPDTEKAK